MKELLDERDKALRLQASVYEVELSVITKELEGVKKSIGSISDWKNNMIGKVAAAIFILGVLMAIATYFKK